VDAQVPEHLSPLGAVRVRAANASSPRGPGRHPGPWRHDPNFDPQSSARSHGGFPRPPPPCRLLSREPAPLPRRGLFLWPRYLPRTPLT